MLQCGHHLIGPFRILLDFKLSPSLSLKEKKMAFIHVLKISIKWHWKTEHRDNQLFLHKSNAGFGYLFSNVNIKFMKDRYNKDWVSLFPRNVPYFKAIQKSVVFGYLLSCWVHFCPPHVSPLFPLSIQMFNVDFFYFIFLSV